MRSDVVVIGGGINGTAIARDAALRGLRVVLVEQGDLGEGTSSWNSRLIHGGIRYLEHYEFRLVRESLREREILLHSAPHLVRPYPLLIPFYAHNRRSAALLRTGMAAYDVLSFDKTTPWHRPVSAAGLRRDWAGLARQGLSGGALYYDAQVPWAERLSVENALAAREVGAEIRTHTAATRLLREGGRVAGIWARSGDDEYPIRAAVTINATGPWIDELSPEKDRLIGGTKGSHLVVEKFPGAPETGVHYEAASDGRAILVLPWQGRYLIGTTDLYCDGDPGAVVAEDAEIDYLLAETNRLVPSAGLTRDDVLWSYCGVRPLPAAPAAGSEAEVSRDHIIHDHRDNLLSIIGGKLTTHRALAEQTVDKVLQLLGRRRRGATRRLPLPGGRTVDWPGFAARFRAEAKLPEGTAERLLGIYGTRAPEVLRLAAEPGLDEEFAPGAIAAELVFAFSSELAGNLTDALLRRTMLGLGPDVGLGLVDAAGEVLGRHLSFSEAEIERQVADYRATVRKFRPRAKAGATK
ncbi:MAG TPA: glycerol-3-phosphate dehydrogenase [Amycolatopsis sp.]|nr:glycerol-3-phosphate dehydrogenase [Amycolatopsis sp.]